MFILALLIPSAFGIVWIIEMQVKQYGTNILVFTMGKQA
jgi:hypothetical protein